MSGYSPFRTRSKPYSQEAADRERKRLRIVEVKRWVVVGEDGEVESLPWKEPLYAKTREDAEQELEGLVDHASYYYRYPVEWTS